jgi:hypothetical protein
MRLRGTDHMWRGNDGVCYCFYLARQETCAMEIIGRNPTPDNYSIKDIKLTSERVHENHFAFYLLVSLKPGYYQRNRYGNDSFEKKKNPCQLRIPLSEFHKIEDALRRELQDCYQFIGERDLLRELWTHKNTPTEQTKKAG